jgi:hypothetical protein
MFISISGFSQPSAKKKNVTTVEQNNIADVKDGLETIQVQGIYRTDTLLVRLAIEDEEGYIKRINGRMIARMFVPLQGQPMILEQKYFNDKWLEIKSELVVPALTQQIINRTNPN